MPAPRLQPYITVVDTREQYPYFVSDDELERLEDERGKGVERCPTFIPEQRCISGTLCSGDYSIQGLESVVAVERKSLRDFWGCLTSHKNKGKRVYTRERFEAELQRLGNIRYSAVIIECEAADLQKPLLYVAKGGKMRASKVPPAVASSSVIGWAWRYRVPIWPAGDRKRGEAWTRKFLDNAWRLHHEAVRVQRKEAKTK